MVVWSFTTEKVEAVGGNSKFKCLVVVTGVKTLIQSE